MKNKIKLILFIIVILSLFLFIGFTNSRYSSNATMTGTLDFVKSIIDIDVFNPTWIDANYFQQNGYNLTPGNSTTVRYQVTNKDEKGNINDEPMVYYIEVIEPNVEHPPIEITKFGDVTDGSYWNPSKTYNYVEGKGYGPVELKAGEEETRIFEVSIRWNLEINDIRYGQNNFELYIQATVEQEETKYQRKVQAPLKIYPNYKPLEITNIEPVSEEENTYNITVKNLNEYTASNRILYEFTANTVGHSEEPIGCTIMSEGFTGVIGNNSTATTKVKFYKIDGIEYSSYGNDDFEYIDVVLNIYLKNPYDGITATNDNSIRIETPILPAITLAEAIKKEEVKKEFHKGEVFEGVATAEDTGLCKMDDTYFFRGNVANNNVSFGGWTWRIVNINEEGNIKLALYSSTSADKNYSTGSSWSWGGVWNNSFDSVGDTYKYSASLVNSSLNSWYNTNLASYESNIVDTTFYEDVSYEGTTFNNNKRIKTDKKPSLSAGQPFLSKIAILTVDEVMLSGSNFGMGGTSGPSGACTYLADGNFTSKYWLMSLSHFPGDGDNKNIGSMFVYQGNVGITNLDTNGWGLVKPVISINGNTTAFIGKGTVSEPYKITE